MKTYFVNFVEYYGYEVEVEEREGMDDIDLEDEAVDKAFELYERDKRCPVATLAYDEVSVEEIK